MAELTTKSLFDLKSIGMIIFNSLNRLYELIEMGFLKDYIVEVQKVKVTNLLL